MVSGAEDAGDVIAADPLVQPVVVVDKRAGVAFDGREGRSQLLRCDLEEASHFVDSTLGRGNPGVKSGKCDIVQG